MVKKTIVVLLSIFTIAAIAADNSLVGKDRIPVKSSSIFKRMFGFEDLASNVHNDGKIALYFQNDGLMGYYNPTLEFPTNSERQYFWQMGTMISANVDDVPKVSDAYEDYGGKNFSPVQGYHDPYTGKVAMSDQPETWSDWPNGLNTGEDGWPGMAESEYEIVGTQESFWVMRDYNASPGDEYFGNTADGTSVGQLEVACRGLQFNTTSTSNILYFRYDITNKGESALSGMRFGILVDPDHPAHVGEEYNDDNAEFDAERGLVISYDYDNSFVGWPGADIAYVGLEFVDTPSDESGNELGLTGCSVFTYGDMPLAGSVLGQTYDTQDAAQYAYMVPGYFSPSPLVNRDIVYIASTGDFSLDAGETTTVVFAVIAAETREKLVNTADVAKFVFANNFATPSAPSKPEVTAVAGNREVTLFWEADPSESSVDKLTGKEDFEGYRIYRSVDAGTSWGTPTDDLENYPIGYLPVTDFNKVNSENETGFVSVTHSVSVSEAAMSFVEIVPGTYSFTDNTYVVSVVNDGFIQVFDSKSGENLVVETGEALIDGFAILPADTYDTAAPVYSENLENYVGQTSAPYSSGDYIYFGGVVVAIDGTPSAGDGFVVSTTTMNAGDNNGLKHSFVDTDVMNGIEYWYAVTAYDRPDLEFSYPRNETTPASTPNTPANPHTVAVIPTAPINNFEPGGMSVDSVTHTEGLATGYVQVDILDASQIADGTYSVEVNVVDEVATFNLLKGAATVLSDQTVIEEGDYTNPDGVPTVDGWRISVVNQSDGFVGFSRNLESGAVSAYDSTCFCKRDSIEFRGGFVPYRDVAFRFESGYQSHTDFNTSVDVPFKVVDITNPANEFTLHSHFHDNGDGVWTPDERIVVLEVPTSESFPTSDSLSAVDSTYMSFSVEFVIALNDSCDLDNLCGFDGNQNAWDGEEWVFQTSRSFADDNEFNFTMNASMFANELDLEGKVRVVPNPFIVSAAWDDRQGETKLQFTNLPETCTIDIYTIAGDHVKTLNHDGGSYEWWDLRTKSDMDIAYGVYLYHVEAENSDGNAFETTGKILVVR